MIPVQMSCRAVLIIVNISLGVACFKLYIGLAYVMSAPSQFLEGDAGYLTFLN